MRVLFFIICLQIFTGRLGAQTKLTITYQTTYEPYGESTFPKVVNYKILLVTNDSLSYSITYQSKYDSSHLPVPLGSKFRGHSTFVNYSNKLMLFQSHPMGTRRLLVSDTFKTADWKLHDETKTIAGYLCKKQRPDLKTGTLLFFIQISFLHLSDRTS